MNVTEVPVSALEHCERSQVRAGMNSQAVKRYKDDMDHGDIFAPVVVYREKGTERYVIADGHHRVHAAREAGKQTIAAEIREGDETAALEFALGANTRHGLQLSKPDIEKAVRLLEEHPILSDRYRTDQEKAELLRMSERNYRRYSARWRESKDPSDSPKVQKAKQAARQRAERHTSPSRPKNGSGEEPDSCPVQANNTRGAPLPHAELHGLRQGIGLVAACRLDMAKVAAQGGIDWSVVEAALDKLTELLANR